MKHIHITDKAACCGCGACAFGCPAYAIRMKPDSEGFLYPDIDEQICIECGKCLHICNYTNMTLAPRAVDKVIGCKHKNEAIRQSSRSGGVFTAISDYILQQGGVVYGAAFTKVDRVEHIRAETKTERDRLKGSKYVQSEIGVFPDIKKDLERGIPVLFSGTPCQTAALAKLFNPREYTNLLLIDFICHGVPSQPFWRTYLDWFERKHHCKISSFDFRDKRMHPWESHVEKLGYNGKIAYSRRYANLFCANLCLRPACYACPYTAPGRVSDITIADFWGIDDIRSDFNDHNGISLCLIRGGEKSAALFEAIKDELSWFETDLSRITHYNLKRPTQKPNNRDEFWSDLKSKGFGYVSTKYGGYGLFRRIKRKLFDKID